MSLLCSAEVGSPRQSVGIEDPHQRDVRPQRGLGAEPGRDVDAVAGPGTGDVRSQARRGRIDVDDRHPREGLRELLRMTLGSAAQVKEVGPPTRGTQVRWGRLEPTPATREPPLLSLVRQPRLAAGAPERASTGRAPQRAGVAPPRRQQSHRSLCPQRVSHPGVQLRRQTTFRWRRRYLYDGTGVASSSPRRRHAPHRPRCGRGPPCERGRRADQNADGALEPGALQRDPTGVVTR